MPSAYIYWTTHTGEDLWLLNTWPQHRAILLCPQHMNQLNSGGDDQRAKCPIRANRQQSSSHEDTGHSPSTVNIILIFCPKKTQQVFFFPPRGRTSSAKSRMSADETGTLRGSFHGAMRAAAAATLLQMCSLLTAQIIKAPLLFSFFFKTRGTVFTGN